MSGLPESNFPAFHLAAAALRHIGYEVENPAENQVPPCGGTWGGYMRLAIAQLVTCEQIALLPGWEDSKGACLEHRIASDLGMTITTVGALLSGNGRE